MIFYLDPRDREALKGNPSFNLFRALAPGGYMLMFNLRDPLLSNPKIREALSLAVNRKEIIENLEGGAGVISKGPFHPNSSAYNPDIKPVDYNPLQALSLLEGEGFILQDGVLNKEGKKLILNLLVDSENEHLIRIAKMIRQQLQEIGIVSKIHFFSDYKELSQMVYSDHSTFEAYLFPFNTGTDPDVAAVYWQSSSPFNLGHYQNAEVDRLFQLARRAHNPLGRAGAYQKIHRIIAEERPAVFLYVPYVFYAVSKRVFNAEKLSASLVSLHLVKKVYKEENL